MNEVDMSIDAVAFETQKLCWPVEKRFIYAKSQAEDEIFRIRYGYKDGKVPGEQVQLNVSPLGAVARVSWAWVRGLVTRTAPMP